MKRVLSAAAALTLALSLGASALAYSGTITLNGTKLDTAKLPDAPAGSVIPLRAVAEADYGFADWYADENRSFFSLDFIHTESPQRKLLISTTFDAVPGRSSAEFPNGSAL